MGINVSTTTNGNIVPAHVPRECIWDNDFTAYLSEGDDPFVAGGRLHDGPGVIWATNATYGMPSWIFTRHALISEGFSDARKFSSLPGPITKAVRQTGRLSLPVESDAPDHAQYRKILQPFFTPKAVGQMHNEVQGLCDSLIDAFSERGHCEFIGEFASVLPNAIVISMMGLPRDMLGPFLEWERTAIRGATIADRVAAGNAIQEYLNDFLAAQRRSGQPASELMAAILHGQMDDRALNQVEMEGIVYLLFLAGLDTTLASLGWIIRHLAKDRALQSRLRNNPEDIPLAIEEFGRAFGVSAPPRVVAEDTEFHGVPMKKGDNVFLPTFLAGRDPRAWPNPHVIDIDRRPRHATFGVGAHVCLGIHLTKREIAVMLGSILSKLDNIRIPDGQAVEFHTAGTIGVDVLPLAWDLKNPRSRLGEGK